ncbi:YacL family protein [Catenovulum sediminis]|uniref:YacL family protein n=1 Tax=Catenovulum sediminis TaxID=1740262 RepID=A0ABV1RBY4_9ALTE|nr:YacL family protein [Catenovulum sediminis]
MAVEYDFYRSADGEFQAVFTTEQEAFGYWFTDEIGNNRHKIAELLNIVTQVQKKDLQQHTIQGATHQLIIDRDEVRVIDNAKPLSNPNTTPEDDNDDFESIEENDEQETEEAILSDDALICGCGLDDFVTALKAWLRFINED